MLDQHDEQDTGSFCSVYPKHKRKAVPSYSEVVVSHSTQTPSADHNQGSSSSGDNTQVPQQVPLRRQPVAPPVPHSRQPSHPVHTTGQVGLPIPVVQLGTGRHHVDAAASAAQGQANFVGSQHQQQAPSAAVRTRPQHPPSHRTTTVVIGTSLIHGLGPRLNKLGVSATTYMYRGATVPDLQSRVKNILNSHEKPDRIVLQCGGNDAERQPAEVVTTRIETLVHNIKRLSYKRHNY